MPRISEYSKYTENMSEEDIKNFLETIRHLYLDENLTREEISNELNISFKIIRGAINAGKFVKSREQHYKRIAENSAKTNIKKYGTKCTLNTDESVKKKKETWIKNYGVDNPSKSDIIKSKKESTTLRHYGFKSHFQSEEIKNKIIQTNIEKYGHKSPMQEESHRSIQRNMFVPDYARKILYNKDELSNFLSKFSNSDRTWNNICKELNYYSHTTIIRQCKLFNLYNKFPINNFRSHYEDDICDFIRSIDDSTNIKPNCKSVIHPYEIDIYFPDFNFGIEFNGVYWHQDSFKGEMYHQNKSFKSKENGIFIYNIWEHEWNDPRKQKIIKSQIRNLLHKNERIIYARKCEIKEISPSICREFLNKNHLQGNRNSKYKFGLFYNNELVSVMTFGMNKFIRKNSNDVELLRFCNKKNVSVVGGASKLFKYFLNLHPEFKRIVSYCDISKGTGKLYENLGFKLEKVTSPNYVWINLNDNEIKSRYQTQMKNEKEIMESQGFIKISDCGNYKFVYNKN